MAKFYAQGAAIFQEPIENIASDGSKSVSIGFRVAICDNGCDDKFANDHNAEIVVKSLNRDDDLKELATWLLKQRSLFLSQKRRELLEGIVNDK